MCKAPTERPTYHQPEPAPARTPEEVIRTEVWIEKQIRSHSNSWRAEVKAQPDGGWKVSAESPGIELTLPAFLHPRQVAALTVKNIETIWRCQERNLLAD